MKKTHTNRAFSLPEILLAVVIISILLLLATGAYRSMLEASHSTGCISNLRALSVMMNNYANDHDGCYPPGYDSDKNTWLGHTAAYRSEINANNKTGITFCPATRMNGKGIYKRDATTWRTDYNINKFVASAEQSQNKRVLIPSKLLFLFDGVGATSGSMATSKECPRHRGDTLNILFVDGHVETTDDLQKYNQYWQGK